MLCFIYYYLGSKKSAKYPFMINFELGNYCNMNCLFCRTINGDIYDAEPGSNKFIQKGEMDYNLYASVIDEVKDHLLLAVLYVNGEPLLYKDLVKAIKYANERNIATIIATNGMLLNEKNIRLILGSGLGFIKIAISGFTQDTYKIQHRNGNIEAIKDNITMLSNLNKRGGHKLIIMLDYILYSYNKHEVDHDRKFCKGQGIMFNIRPGNPRGLEDEKDNYKLKVRPTEKPCDWLWKVLTINWDGSIFACCDHASWSSVRPYGKYALDKTSIYDIWNGKQALEIRGLHVSKGRRSIPACAGCSRKGIAFKY